MCIGLLEAKIDMPCNQSLKDKRAQVKRIIARLQRMNLSVIESGYQELQQTAGISVVFAAGSSRLADEIFSSIISCLDAVSPGDVMVERQQLL